MTEEYLESLAMELGCKMNLLSGHHEEIKIVLRKAQDQAYEQAAFLLEGTWAASRMAAPIDGQQRTAVDLIVSGLASGLRGLKHGR